jgi:hypothetical protein
VLRKYLWGINFEYFKNPTNKKWTNTIYWR